MDGGSDGFFMCPRRDGRSATDSVGTVFTAAPPKRCSWVSCGAETTVERSEDF